MNTGRLRRILAAAIALALLLALLPAGASGDAGQRYIIKNRASDAPFEVVSEAEMERLDRLGLLEWYEPDGEAVLLGEYSEEQWNLAMIGASAGDGDSGKGVRVGILDSGVNPHPDLADRLLEGRNYIEGATDPEDTSDAYGHGTRVAGLVAAAGEEGQIGVAPGALLVPLKVTDGKSVKVSALCRAIYGAIDDYGCRVLNLSLGVTTRYAVLAEAMAYAEARGVTVVSAAGNGGTGELLYPAAYDTVIGVGAVDSSGTVYARSNHSSAVFLTAPGVAVRSTANQGGYADCTGTSYATPHVAGAAAALLGMEPDLSPADLRALLADTASDRGTAGYDLYYGHGVVDLAAAVAALSAGEIPPPPKDNYVNCKHDGECPLSPFSDLDENAWYHDGVHWTLDEGVMKGVGGGRFVPDGTTSRAMLVTVLWRLAGEPASDAPMGFADVAPEAWYAGAVRWAYSRGVVTGYTAECFGPGDPVTREQLAAILWRYAGSPEAEENLERFQDAGTASPWALEALRWAVRTGLLRGVDAETLRPDAGATRAQTAAVLLRFTALMQ